jgi:hypothetical protein
MVDRWMANALGAIDLGLIRRDADRTARRLVRRFRMGTHERDEFRQDLVADVITRCRSYDPSRGTWGAFVGTILAHRAAQLAMSVRRERKVFAPVSLDHPLPGTKGGIIRGMAAERDGYAAWLDHSKDAADSAERRLDLDRALGTLGQSDRALCAALAWNTPGELRAWQ